MSDEKKIILRMLKEGKITEEEAITLLDSIKDNNKPKNDFSQFESNIIEKITQAATKIGKKSQEMINSFDFEDINIKFNSNLEQKTKAERIVSENIIGVENPELEITNRNGKIVVETWDNEEIEAKSDINYDERFVSSNHNFIKIQRQDNKVIIEPDYEKATPKHFDMNVKVSIPKRFFENITLSSTNANIEINNVETNNLVVESTNAKIKVKEIKSNNSTISSTNARISVDGIDGEELKINTTNGKIELNNLDTKKVELITTNGTILVANLKDKVERITASTNNGNILVSLKDLFKPVKAKVTNYFKDIDTSNFSDSKFSNFVTEDGSMIAYSDGYDEEGEKLDIEASTYNGTVNIN